MPIPPNPTVSVEKPTRMRDGRWRCRYRWYDAHGQRQGRLAYGMSPSAARTQAQLEGHHEMVCAQAIFGAAPMTMATISSSAMTGAETAMVLAAPEVIPTATARYATIARLSPLQAPVHPPTPPTAPTFAEVAAEALISTVPARQKPKQVHHTRNQLDTWWLPAIGHLPIDAITPAELNKVTACARRTMSPASCNRLLAAAAVIFRHAEAADLIIRVPTTRATKLREGRKIPVIYSAHELVAVLWALDDGWRLFVALMALAGLRKTEAKHVRVDDISLDSGYLVVRGGDDGTKSGHERMVPIISSLLDAELRSAIHRARRASESRLVVLDDPRKAIRRAVEQSTAGKCVSPHRLRHGFASLVHAGGIKQPGVPIRTVQAWLGHSCLSVTERYTHLARPTLAADLLFDRLGTALGGR